MKTPLAPGRWTSLSSPVNVIGALLIAATLISPSSRADQLDVTFRAFNGSALGYRYSDSSNWTPQVVPNNGNGGNTFRITIPGTGPYQGNGLLLDIDATVDSLVLQQTALASILYDFGHSITSAATRVDAPASSFISGIAVGESSSGPGIAKLGELANYNKNTQTLEGGFYSVRTFRTDGTPAVLSFNGARIVTNSASISILTEVPGAARITDEFGADALQPLAVNNGFLDVPLFHTAGDFRNNGQLYSRGFVVTGQLLNFDPTSKTLSGGTYFLGDNAHPGGTISSAREALQFPGADIVTNAATLVIDQSANAFYNPPLRPAIVDENGVDGLRNLANNAATGSLTLHDKFTVTARRFTNAGYLAPYLAFTLPPGGVFEQSGGELSLIMPDYFLQSKLDTSGGSVLLDRGRLTGSGTVVGETTNNAVISPGDGNYTPKIVFNGNLTLGSSSVLDFDVAGAARAPGRPSVHSGPGGRVYGYDAIDCSAGVAIDGQLHVNLSTATSSRVRFTPVSSSTFVLLKSQTPLVGSFRNVANGQRVGTTDGGGSFLVNYGPNTTFDPTAIVLSDFQPNTSPATILNISTRGLVGGGERVMVGGFIITGSEPKPVILRAIGPSLGNFGVAGALADPTLALYDSNGAAIASNDDWQQSPQWTDIQATGIPPSDAREAAIVATLAPGTYTAVLEGKNGATGVALVEVYDLNAGAQSQLANISTRGYADTGENVLIGGMIIGGGTGNTDILIRALGPSLSNSGVTAVMDNPYLALYQGGTAIDSNDDWRTHQAAIQATGIPPTDDRESAIVRTLPPGAYTARVFPSSSGSGSNRGVGLVEFYRLR